MVFRSRGAASLFARAWELQVNKGGYMSPQSQASSGAAGDLLLSGVVVASLWSREPARPGPALSGWGMVPAVVLSCRGWNNV